MDDGLDSGIAANGNEVDRVPAGEPRGGASCRKSHNTFF